MNAFNSLGYQLFEPNVRAEIKKSKVNQAIRESVMYSQTRRDFRFLNNGVTFTCDSYNLPRKPNKPCFTVRHPGVINGLQTVVALHTAYQELLVPDQEEFEKDCAVLVRLLKKNVVENITDVVKATNNQNPMLPRNLVSNNIEQVIYVHTFAEKLGWFYEAKQGAWDAFRNDPKRWRPRLNMRAKDFQPADKRKRIRRVDNHDLAQKWLSFIGFARIALNQRKYLFDDKYYQLIFKQRTRKHGYNYTYEVKRAIEHAENQSPDVSLILVSHLAHEFARMMTPSPQENRKEACTRLGLDSNMPKVELDVELNKDDEYVINQALNAMSFLFIEFVGFIFFNTFSEGIHQQGNRILANYSFKSMVNDLTPLATKEQIEAGVFNEKDVLVVLWSLFVDTIEGLFQDKWGESYRAAQVKTRFILRPETRNQLYKRILDADVYLKRLTL